LKRSFDILSAFAGLLMLLPLLTLIAALVFLGDGNTPWFRGVRVGKGRRGFRMVKFRTMIPDAWKSGVSSTGAADRRITRVGRLLRRAKLDELPQLWNVLIGDMSLVGPRPQVEADAALYSVEEQRLFKTRPGITDLASIVFAVIVVEGSPLAHVDTVIATIVVTVAVSVYAHGLTALPLTEAYGRWYAARAEPPAMESAAAHEHRWRRPTWRPHI